MRPRSVVWPPESKRTKSNFQTEILNVTNSDKPPTYLVPIKPANGIIVW